MKEVRFCIDNMTCQACSSGIERSLKRKPYCESIEVSLINKRAKLVYDEQKVSLDTIFAFIEKMGYKPYFESDSQSPKSPTLKTSRKSLFASFNSLDEKLLPPTLRLILSIVFTLFVLTLSWGEMFFHISLPYTLSYYLQLFGALVVMHMGRAFYFRGYKSLFALNPNMDTLIAVGTTSAFLYSLKGIFDTHGHFYFDSVCVIITLVSIGKTIENLCKKDAKDSASLLLEINQKSMIKLSPQNLQTSLEDLSWLDSAIQTPIIAQDVRQGDYLKVLPGEMVMVDSFIVQGRSSIEQSAISGEALPILKQTGDTLLSGSINLESPLVIKAQKNAKESTLAEILTLVQNAQDSKAPISTLADKISGIFVPLVIGLALCAGIYWWIIKDFVFALDIFIATLVISCPCALGLATPMAILYAQAKSNKMGLFFKDAKSLEMLRKVTHIVFDKTGTLSDGLEISSILCLDDSINPQELFAIAYHLESSSTHIIANAFKNHPFAKDAGTKPVEEFQNIVGYGIYGIINGTKYIMGNAEILPPLLQSQIPTDTDKTGKMNIYIATESTLLGIFHLIDHIKPNVIATLHSLQSQDISISIVSGDNAINTQKIAQKLGINHFIANAKPQDKMQALENLKKQGHYVLMVGDGINDAPALAQADISMAFVTNNDIAHHSADIIIYNNDIKVIYNAYRLSQATIKNIKGNLFWAFGYNIIFIPIAMGALSAWGIKLEPMFCALAMSFSSISVLLNASRLKKFKIL